MLVQLEKAVLLIQQRLGHAEHRHCHHKAVADHHILKHQNAVSRKQDHQVIAHPRTHRIHKQPIDCAPESVLPDDPDSILCRRGKTSKEHVTDMGRPQLLGVFGHVMHPPYVVGLAVRFGQLHLVSTPFVIFLSGKHKVGYDLEPDKKNHKPVQRKGQPGQRRKAEERPEKHLYGIKNHSRTAFQCVQSSDMLLKIFRILITFQIHFPGLVEGQLHEMRLNLQIGPWKKTVLQKNVHQMARKRKKRQKPHNGKNRLKGCGGLDLVEHISHRKHPKNQPF